MNIKGNSALNLKKINTSSVVQRVIDRLTGAIIRGELKPGDRIPTELELSEQLGVARNSIREAIKILVYMGVLEIRRADGTFVCDGFSESLMDPLVYGIILNRQNEKELNELRAMMESGVLQLAAQTCTDQELRELQTRLLCLKAACMKENADSSEVFRLDNEFHEKVAEMGHNAMVAKINAMTSVLTYSIRLRTVEQMIGEGRGEELYLAHERVYRQLAERDTNGLYNMVFATYFTDTLDKTEQK